MAFQAPTTLSVRPRVILRTAGWSIREFCGADAEQLRHSINDPAIARLIGPLPSPYTVRHARAWISLCRRQYRQSGHLHRHYAIIMNDQVVGGIGADRDGQQAEFGYWLTRSLWGRGMMTAVVRRFVPYLFRVWPIERVVAKTFLFNPASSRVLEKNGFQQSAVEVRSVRRGRRWFDSHVFTRYRSR